MKELKGEASVLNRDYGLGFGSGGCAVPNVGAAEEEQEGEGEVVLRRSTVGLRWRGGLDNPASFGSSHWTSSRDNEEGELASEVQFAQLTEREQRLLVSDARAIKPARASAATTASQIARMNGSPCESRR